MDDVQVKAAVSCAQFEIAALPGQSRKAVDRSLLSVVGLLECRDAIKPELVPYQANRPAALRWIVEFVDDATAGPAVDFCVEHDSERRPAASAGGLIRFEVESRCISDTTNARRARCLKLVTSGFC